MADNVDQKEVQHVNIKVMGQDNNEIAFRIKKTAQLRKLMDAYVQKLGVDAASVRFLWNGSRVDQGDTPEGLGMEDEETIQTQIMQVGGSE